MENKCSKMSTETLSKFSKFFKKYKKIVIKVGSSLLVDQDSGELKNEWIQGLAKNISILRAIDKEVIVVSSGAIALGRNVIDLETKNLKLEQSQAAAAIGQITLAHAWKYALGKENIKCAQILLSPEDTETRRKHLNARATLSTLLQFGVVPVINENDTITTSEIRFGDNDRLAARVSQMSSSDLLILLSDIDGLYDKDPNFYSNAKHIAIVNEISKDIIKMAGSSNYEYASGGMITKVEAAKITRVSGCNLIICNGEKINSIRFLAEGSRHTLFKANNTPLSARKSWIAAGLNIDAGISLDKGAVLALKNGSSLLPAGILNVFGSFERGDLINILDQNNVKVASGLTAYGSGETKLIAGKNTKQIKNLLGYSGRDEIIHRDDLVLNEKNIESL